MNSDNNALSFKPGTFDYLNYDKSNYQLDDKQLIRPDSSLPVGCKPVRKKTYNYRTPRSRSDIKIPPQIQVDYGSDSSWRSIIDIMTKEAKVCGITVVAYIEDKYGKDVSNVYRRYKAPNKIKNRSSM